MRGAILRCKSRSAGRSRSPRIARWAMPFGMVLRTQTGRVRCVRRCACALPLSGGAAAVTPTTTTTTAGAELALSGDKRTRAQAGIDDVATQLTEVESVEQEAFELILACAWRYCSLRAARPL